MENKGEILSLELHESKLGLIEKGAERLGISIVSPKTHDGRLPIEEYMGKADYVICDVPCSGMGVLRKKPEIRYKSIEDIGAIPPLQSEILESAFRYLKAGGRLLYATCTVLSQENEKVVEECLSRHKSAAPAPFTVGDLSAPSGMLTLLPHIHSTDGFFIALIQKS